MSEFYGDTSMRTLLDDVKDGLDSTKADIEATNGAKMNPLSGAELNSDFIDTFYDSSSFGDKTVSENGTYEAADDGYLGYKKVIVNVASGGTSVDLTFLPNSDSSKVLVSQGTDSFIQNLYNETGNWNKIRSVSTGISKVNDGVVVPQYNTMFYNLTNHNVDSTIYLVGKSNINDGTLRVITRADYNSSSGIIDSAPGFYNKDGKFIVSVWNGSTDAFIEYDTSNKYVIALKCDVTNNSAKFFLNGELVKTLYLAASGKIIEFEGNQVTNPVDGSYCNSATDYYVGVVNEAEADATIIANMEHLMDVFNIPTT